MSIPYQLESNDVLSFTFTTDQGVRYKAYFLDHNFLFEAYPQLQPTVYTFNLEVIEGTDISKPVPDERIGMTVASILSDFFQVTDRVLIFVCDSMDERPLARRRKFDRWFAKFNGGFIFKEDGIAFTEGTAIYNSMLIHHSNSQLKEYLEAFNDLNSTADQK